MLLLQRSLSRGVLLIEREIRLHWLRHASDRPELSRVHVDPDVYLYLAAFVVTVRERRSIAILECLNELISEINDILELEVLMAREREGTTVSSSHLEFGIVAFCNRKLGNTTEFEVIKHFLENDFRTFRHENLLLPVMSSLCEPFRNACTAYFERYLACVQALEFGLTKMNLDGVRVPVDKHLVETVESAIGTVTGSLFDKRRDRNSMLLRFSNAWSGGSIGLRNSLPELRMAVARLVFDQLGESIFPLFKSNMSRSEHEQKLQLAKSYLVSQGFSLWSARIILDDCLHRNWRFHFGPK